MANDEKPGTEDPGKDRENLGRSRGGLTTKIHLGADTRCRPLSRVTTAGQRHDSLAMGAVLRRVRLGRSGPGPARTRPDGVLADKACSTAKIRAMLRRRRIVATIPQPSNQVAGRKAWGSKGGRPPAFDEVRYKERNTVERAINKLREHRAVATRTDKRDFVYRGTIDVATSGSGPETSSYSIHGTGPNVVGVSRNQVNETSGCPCRGGRPESD